MGRIAYSFKAVEALAEVGEKTEIYLTSGAVLSSSEPFDKIKAEWETWEKQDAALTRNQPNR